MTRQKLTALLKRGGLEPSRSYPSGQIKGMNHYTEGYSLKVVEANVRFGPVGTPRRPRWAKVSSDVVGFKLEYIGQHSIMLSSEERERIQAAGLERVRAALRDAGVPFKEKGGELFVPAPAAPSE